MNNFDRPKSINDTYLFNKLYDNGIYTGSLCNLRNYQLIPKLLKLNPDNIELSAFSNSDAESIYEKLNKIFKESEIYNKLEETFNIHNLNLYQRFLKISDSIYICTYYGFDIKHPDVDVDNLSYKKYYYVIINLKDNCVIYSPDLIINESYSFERPKSINDTYNYPQAVKRFKNIKPLIKTITITQNRQDIIKLDKKIFKHFNRIIFIYFTDSSTYDKLKLNFDDSFINLIKNDISQLNKKGEKVEYIDILYSKDFGRMIKLVVYHLITPVSISSTGEEGKFYLNLFFGDEPFYLNESYSFERPKSINDTVHIAKDIWKKFDIPKIYKISTHNILYNDSIDILTYMVTSDIDVKLHYENGLNDRALKGGGIYKKDIIIKDLSKINQKAKHYLDKYNCELYLIELKKPIPIKYFYIGVVIIKLSDNPNAESEFNDNNYAFTIPIEADNVKLLYNNNLNESLEFKKPTSINDTYLINKLKPLNEIVILNDIDEVHNMISYLDSNNFTNDYELFENTYMKGEIKKIFNPADFIDYIKRKYFLNSDHTIKNNIKKIAIRYSIEYDLCIMFFNDILYDEVMYICFKTSDEIKKALDENVI